MTDERNQTEPIDARHREVDDRHIACLRIQMLALDADFDFMPLRQAVPATIEELALFRGSNAQGAHQFPAQKAS